MTFSPERDHLIAVYESKTALPTAAPGDAAMPRPILVDLRLVVEAREHQLRELGARHSLEGLRLVDQAGFDQLRGDGKVLHPPVRSPMRVWSIHSWPRSMVNSMSQRSL